jgi:hypothetical protein
MATTSSTIAMVSTRSFTPEETRSPNSARTPTAKAMSVAMGILHPSPPAPPAVSATKIAAGRIAPPSAAKTGSAAALRSRNSPVTNSRLISSPTTKKKMAMRPSLTQC